MPERIAIVGMGYADIRSITPGVSYKEIMYEAACRAYEDAGIDPRKDVDSFISVSEDFWEGTSIFDEYIPDQLGAAMRPAHTVSGDGLQALACAAMLIQTGQSRIVVVEGHSKHSDICTPIHIHQLAFDPIYHRPLEAHPQHLAGLEMSRFLYESGNHRDHCAMVVKKNRLNALSNPRAVYGAQLSIEEIVNAESTFSPLAKLDASYPADGAFVTVVAAEEAVKDLPGKPVWITGYGWCTETPAIDSRSWGEAAYARLAAQQAYAMAKVTTPSRDLDFAEVDDAFSYKELQHLEALAICRPGESGACVASGMTLPTGDFPVNVSGGSLGVGHLLEATGLHRLLEAVLQLRGQAGALQLPNVRRGLVQSWRNLPTTTGCVVILESA